MLAELAEPVPVELGIGESEKSGLVIAAVDSVLGDHPKVDITVKLEVHTETEKPTRGMPPRCACSRSKLCRIASSWRRRANWISWASRWSLSAFIRANSRGVRAGSLLY